MKHINNNEKLLLNIFLFLIIIIGIYFCFIGGYGSDEDTLPMIYVFEAKLHGGRFVSSRYTGNPVAELGIGFLSYFFGSWAANLSTYLFLLLGLIAFYFSFEKKEFLKEINIFLFLSLTSPVLFFDNLDPIDYSWAFFFFSLGLLFLSKKIFELSILFFAFSIGVRINYTLFVLIAIFFFESDSPISFNRRITLFLSTFIIGGLFYLPVWFDNSFNLSWLTAGRPIDQGIGGLLARFIYKLYISLGYISFFVLIYYFYKFFTKFKTIKNIRFLILLCLSNLAIFLWIPSELSYLQLFLVAINFIVFKINIKKFIYFVCIGNLISWFVFVSPIKIIYNNNELCAPKNAISAVLDLKLEKGFYFKYIESRDKIKCWVHGNSERDKRILKGEALKLD